MLLDIKLIQKQNMSPCAVPSLLNPKENGNLSIELVSNTDFKIHNTLHALCGTHQT